MLVGYSCWKLWIESGHVRGALLIQPVTLCVFCLALFPAASGRRKVWLYLPGPVCGNNSEYEFPQTVICGSNTELLGCPATRFLWGEVRKHHWSAFSFQLHCCTSLVQDGRTLILISALHRINRLLSWAPLQPVSRAVMC